MTENKNKTHIKKKIYMASSLSDLNMKNNRKNHTKRKNKKYNINQKQKHKQKGGQESNQSPSLTSSNQYFQKAEEDLDVNSSEMLNDQEQEQPQINLNNLSRVPQEHALVGTYNNPNKDKQKLELNKNIEKSRGGLYVSYPPPINTTKETALALKKRDKREEGFTDYKGEITDLGHFWIR